MTFLKKAIKFLLRSKAKSGRLALFALNTEFALERVASRGITVDSIIDIGASNGSWSLMAKKYFSEARVIMIEANPDHEGPLRNLSEREEEYSYIIGAASNERGKIQFDRSSLYGGGVSQEGDWVNAFPVDEISGDYQNILLKLDTHGYEIPIFEGSANTLSRTAVIIVEVYNFDLNETSLRFPQMCIYLENKGFRCIDISEPLFRPKDRALWQFDLVFIRSDSKIFEDTTYA